MSAFGAKESSAQDNDYVLDSPPNSSKFGADWNDMKGREGGREEHKMTRSQRKTEKLGES